MPVITTGLYKVILEQTFSAQVIINTFWFEHTLGDDDDQELCATAFDEDLVAVIAGITNPSLSYVAIRAQNVTGDLADFVLTPTVTAGTLAGLAMNSFTAAGIRLNRTTKETRNGQKRFCGMSEEFALSQVWTAGFITNLEFLAGKLADQISTVGAIFNPVIARQDPITPTNWIVNAVASATVNADITSQISRKKGQGI